MSRTRGVREDSASLVRGGEHGGGGGGEVTRRWRVDLGEDAAAARRAVASAGGGAPREVVSELCDPPGYLDGRALTSAISHAVGDARPASSLSREERAERSQLLLRRCWDVALTPGKNLFVVFAMLWFSGSSVSIFSIMSTFSLLLMQLRTLSQLNSSFEPLLQQQPKLRRSLLAPKLVYALLCAVGVGAALYKVNTLGFLPLTPADWASLVAPRVQEELTIASVALV